MKILKAICNTLLGLIIVLLMAVAAVLILPTLMGNKNMAVLSGSMEPKIPVGSICIVNPTNLQELQTGDVVTYQIGGDTMVTHRITQIDTVNRQVVTKGDANETEDGSPVPFDNIVGRVKVHIPYLGYISIYAKTPLGIAAICILLFVLILLNFLPEIFTNEEEPKVKSKKRKRRE